MEKWQITLDLIRKYKVSHKLLGELLGMNQSVFSEKLNETRRYKFKDAEKEKITHYLVCMGRVILENLEK